MNSSVQAAEKVAVIADTLSRTSSFDTLSIFIVVAFMVIFFIIVILNYIKLSKDNEILKQEFNDVKLTFKEEINNIQSHCTARSKENKTIIDSSIKYLEISIDNLFNAIIELTKKESPLVCDTKLALELFNYIMDLHCTKKAIKLYERIKYGQTSSVEDLTAQLGREYKEITLDEKGFFDRIYYRNNHTLGEELGEILKKDNWDNFVNTYIKTLVEKYKKGDSNFIEMKDEIFSAFDNLIEPMRKNIIEKGNQSKRRI